jgi:AraC-like DNA-binding protein
MSDLKQSKRFAIDYQGPANGQRYEMWREGICRSFCRLDAEPAGDDCIDCRVDFALMHSLTLATPTGSSARFARTRELLTDGCDDFVLISASQGPVHVTQGEQAIDLAAAQACLIEMNVAAAVVLNNTGRYTTTRMPRHSLLQVAPNAETKLSQPLGENPALMTMIERYFALCNDVAQDLDEVGQQTAAQHLIDLVGLLIGSRADQRELVERRGYSRARIELLKSAALKNLERSNLTIDMVAQANGLSARQAQRLFAQSGVTFTEFVLEQRLFLAHSLLIDARNRHRKVSDIAYAVGFNDLSYFNRAFRTRFGITPSDTRAETGHLH